MNHQLSLKDVRAGALARAEQTIARYVQQRGQGETIVPGMIAAHLEQPMAPTSHLFEPSLCVGIRGEKRIRLEDQVHEYGPDRFLLTTVGLPTIVEIDHAAPGDPYVAVVVKLDVELARSLAAEIDSSERPTPADDAAMVTAPMDAGLLDAAVRLIELLDTPQDVTILSRVIQTEILYRLLTGPVGLRVRQVVRLGSQQDRIARAAAWLRDNVSEAVRMNDLAALSGMGLSTFNRRFQQMTSMSPLQYQKRLRLHEARRILLSEDVDAGSAAYRVGYESDTQFNREYRRLFGDPPRRDIQRLRRDQSNASAPRLDYAATP